MILQILMIMHTLPKTVIFQSGINPESIKWAFTSLDVFYWHPITWLSHMLDWSLFGANAGGHHLISLLLHIGAVIFLFLFLNKTTNNIWPSAFAAAFFRLASPAGGISSLGRRTQRRLKYVFRNGLSLCLRFLCRKFKVIQISSESDIIHSGSDVQAYDGHAAFCSDASGLLAAETLAKSDG